MSAAAPELARYHGGRSVAEEPISRERSATTTLVFALYLFFLLVQFLNLGVRYSFIGVLRPSLLLFGLIAVLLFVQGQFKVRKDVSSTTKLLNMLFIYALISLPFVQWPGSVLRDHLQEFVKVIVLFYFTIQIIDTDSRLKKFLVVVIGCQVVRFLEPLMLHFSYDYWGSRAHMGGGEFMNRLSGAPSDIVNPNGLAFIIITTLPFLHYLMLGSQSKLMKLGYLALLPALLYAFVLTGSRSGLVGLAVVVAMIIWKSNRRVLLMVAVLAVGAAMVPTLSPDQRDRYMSLTSDNAANSATRESRLRGILSDFRVGLRRPIFGHGLGTSQEANWNVRGNNHVSHTLYAEVFIELGIIGLVIFCAFLLSLIRNFRAAKRSLTRLAGVMGADATDFYRRLVDAMETWIAMCLVFSIAQYGLSEFHWYLVGGLSVALLRIMHRKYEEAGHAEAVPSGR
jgi:O-antigen ligase